MTTPALDIKKLFKTFGGLPAIRDVSLRIEVGERRLILGPNGAGKTTLFNHIAGDIAPTAGSIRLFGLDSHSERSLLITRDSAEYRSFPTARNDGSKSRWRSLRSQSCCCSTNLWPDCRQRRE